MRKLKTLILTALFAICGGFHAFAQTDGEYYLFDVKNNLFFSRGAAWGTEASVDKYGIPFTWNSENGSLQFKDNDLYLFNSQGTSLYTDNQSTGFYFTETTDGYYLQDKENNTYVTFSTGGYGYYAHRTTEVGDAIVWQLKTKAERDAIVANYVNENYENVIEAAEIKAGVPVMVKAAAGTEYTINNVFVPATGLQTVAKEDGNAKFVFTGTYAPTTLTEVSFVLINGTKYYYHEAGTTATTAKAFRGYFVDESTSAAKSVIFDFNEATGIESINTIGDNTENGVVYDLQGRRVIKPSKGIYVTNGKKVVIK